MRISDWSSDVCSSDLGKVYHDEPQVLHYGRPGEGLVLQQGMTFPIEPMINEGKRHAKVLPDGWTVVTKDRRLSAQWEHVIAVPETGLAALTPGPGHPTGVWPARRRTFRRRAPCRRGTPERQAGRSTRHGCPARSP